MHLFFKFINVIFLKSLLLLIIEIIYKYNKIFISIYIELLKRRIGIKIEYPKYLK